MKLTLDTESRTLTEEENGETRRFDLYSKEAFERRARGDPSWKREHPAAAAAEFAARHPEFVLEPANGLRKTVSSARWSSA